jgi:glutamate-5-semialdehyde dehydrogenase
LALAKLPKTIEKDFVRLREGARALRRLENDVKSRALHNISKAVAANFAEILKANAKDLKALPKETSNAFRDRLTLNEKRLEGMIESLRQVADLPDPVGELVDSQTLANGLKLQRVRAPFGVIFMIFESRPNVILEAFSLAFKSGNAIALRGGSDSKHTAQVFYALMKKALKDSGVDENSFLGMNNYDRNLVTSLLQRKDLIDIVVPRGGDKLIAFVEKTAHMPIIKNDRGLCHAYIESDADLEMAVRIVTNAKTQRPGVCNSLETVLVHESVAATLLPRLHAAMKEFGVEWHCDADSLKILRGQEKVKAAKKSDWDTEYLEQIINCRIVPNLEEALAHIERHGSKHSEAIVTKSQEKAHKFQMEVDAAAVYWNASTRFTDGFEFGLGGELGISTQKLHVRGPVGLRELTTPRWIIEGNGQIRE